MGYGHRPTGVHARAYPHVDHAEEKKPMFWRRLLLNQVLDLNLIWSRDAEDAKASCATQGRGNRSLPAPPQQPQDLVATPGGSAVKPRARDQEAERALPRGDATRRRVPAAGGQCESARRGARGPAGAPARPPGSRPQLRVRGGGWEAGSRAGTGRVWGARGTHQLQRAEADERAAPVTAAHGAGGVRAARAARDPRLPAPPPPDSGAAPYRRRSPARPRLASTAVASPLAARRSGVWTRAPPLLVSGAGRGSAECVAFCSRGDRSATLRNSSTGRRQHVCYVSRQHHCAMKEKWTSELRVQSQGNRRPRWHNVQKGLQAILQAHQGLWVRCF
ncbi:uncharacterized protein LOC141568658 [Rhinolophus sinicus]|uniref:uncharacterized protein LOC141568658 n=1 Tax=Rhinolophus sinicus TaxID=89399 RepID=UPI003D79002D